MKKNLPAKNWVLLLLIPALILVLWGVFYFLSSRGLVGTKGIEFDESLFGDRTKALEYADRIKDIDNRLAQDQILAAVIDTKDSTRCEVAQGLIIDGVDYGTVCRNNIAFNLAQESLNASYCDELDDKLMSREDCRYQILLAKAAQSDDVNVCAQSSNAEMKLNCETSYWLHKAIQEKDIALCNEWPQEKIGECQNRYALSLLREDARSLSCNVLQAGDRESCVTTRAVWLRESSKDSCASVSHPGWKIACQNANP